MFSTAAVVADSVEATLRRGARVFAGAAAAAGDSVGVFCINGETDATVLDPAAVFVPDGVRGISVRFEGGGGGSY